MPSPPPPDPNSPSPRRLLEMAWGYAPPMIISAAVQHRIFDLLDSGPKTAAEISAANGASLRGARAIMNALTGFGLLTKGATERYSLTLESAMFS